MGSSHTGKDHDRYRPSPVGYQEFSRQFIGRLTRAFRKESWGRTVIQLAWTAGPVTYLALNGGYYIGFGVPAPPQLFFYFGAYTVIAGLFAIMVRIGYNALRGHEHEQMEAALTELMGTVPELIASARNRSLESYEGEDRSFLSAKYLLDNADASEQAIRQAVLDLTDNSFLADTIRSIEVFRRAGLPSRIDDIHQSVSGVLAEALPSIESRSVAVAEEVRRRFSGIAPRKRQGRTRTEGFIERALSAGEHNSYDLMSLSDVEEVLTLIFEFLAGRTFTYFSLQFVGKSVLREVDRRFERLRRELREAIHVRNSRLRVLAEFLNESEAIHRVPAAIPVIVSVGELFQNVERAVNEVYEEIRKRLTLSDHPFGEEDLNFYRTLLHLWESLHRANESVNRRRAELGRGMRDYRRLLETTDQGASLKILAPGQPGNGVRLVPREVGLSAKERMKLALRLFKVFKETERERHFIIPGSLEGTGTTPELNSDGLKHLAVSMAIALDQAVSLSNGKLQSAIETSSAANIGSIETGLSREARIGWGVALVREVREETQKAAARLVSSLAYYHGMQITDEAISWLVEKFGVDDGLLRRFSLENSSTSKAHLMSALEHLEHQFIEIKNLSKAHHALTDRIRQRTKRRGSPSG